VSGHPFPPSLTHALCPKDRLLRHEESKQAGAAKSSGEFFSLMRTQGSG
jgi:hypothetical protein